LFELTGTLSLGIMLAQNGAYTLLVAHQDAA
jgi:hypothetical protein